MYYFEKFNINNVDKNEYESTYKNKKLFCTIEWLRFLAEFRGIEPIIIRITDNQENLIGHFTGGIKKKMGFNILGSPFYGWMGLHMGFEFVSSMEVMIPNILDEFVEYIKANLKISYFIFADFGISKETMDKCKTSFFYETDAKTYFLDLNRTEEEIFKNFKSGYRTCVRKFEKLGGTIEEDYSDEFITEHNKQLIDVFERKNLSAPDYSKRMKLLRDNYKDMTLFIKALDENGNCIASSYYLGAGKMSFFASNASYTKALKYNANQALMWYAIKYWKNKGMICLDLAGTGDYKANFGSEYKTTPICVWTKYKCEYDLIQFLRAMYYKQFRVKHKIMSLFKGDKNESNK